MLEHVVNRVKLSKLLDKVVLAIPDGPQDDVLFNLAEKLNVICVRGSSENVLNRCLKAAKEVRADIIVRITGDCPLIDPGIIDKMIEDFEKTECDYLLNDARHNGYPRGFDVDIFLLRSLEKTEGLADNDYYKEHITTFMLAHPEMFKIRYYEAPKNLYRPDYRLCVDEKLDFALVTKIFNYFKPREDFNIEEIIEYLDKNPKIAKINENVKQRT